MRWAFLLVAATACSLDFGELVDGSTSSAGGTDPTTISTSSSGGVASGGQSSTGGASGGALLGGGGEGGTIPSCGDGTINGVEECDDGNQIDGDGCASDCDVVCSDYSSTAIEDPNTHDCYDAHLVPISYDACGAACFALGSTWHRATLVNAAEIAAALPAASDGWRFVGARRMTDGGTDWAWNALPDVMFSVPWAAGEPVDSRLDGNMESVVANCVAIMENGTFNARPCSWALPCLCEGDPPQLTPP